jgi:hypothetical protein
LPTIQPIVLNKTNAKEFFGTAPKKLTIWFHENENGNLYFEKVGKKYEAYWTWKWSKEKQMSKNGLPWFFEKTILNDKKTKVRADIYFAKGHV